MMMMVVVMNIDEWHYWCVSANIREEMEFDYTITNELLSAMYVFQEAVSNVWVAYYRYSLQYGNLNLFSLHFNGNFSRWTWVFFREAKDDGSGGDSCAMLQSNCHHQQTNTQLFTVRMPFLSPNGQCQSTEGKRKLNPLTVELLPSLLSVCQRHWMSKCNNCFCE